MELFNEVSKLKTDTAAGTTARFEAYRAIVLLLSPITPHITQNLWHTLGFTTLLMDETWPQADESAMQQDELELVVQVNGKLRSRISVAASAPKDAIEADALADENVKKHTDGQTVRKVIVVPGKLVNIVAN